MACLDMFNSDHQSFCGAMSPRISFSNDLMDPNQMIKRERSVGPPPLDSSDFEFSVSNNSMIAADEIFFKGRLLPLKESCTTQLQRMTLRDELRIDEDDDLASHRPPRGPMRWKELLGLRKSSHAMPKKHEKVLDASPLGGRSNVSAPNKASQELRINGGGD